MWQVSGEQLLSVSEEELATITPEGSPCVPALKQHLQHLCGHTRFQQRLLFLGSGAVLHDAAALELPLDLQLVILPYVAAHPKHCVDLRRHIESDKLQKIESLLSRPLNPNLRLDETGRTALHAAASDGRAEIVRILLQARADVDRVNDRGGTPLLKACQRKSPDVIRLLLAARAEVDKADYDERFPLLAACKHKHLDIVRLLLEARADVAHEGGATAVFLACQTGQLELLQLLLAAKASCQRRNSSYETPLLMASLGGHAEMVRLFLEHERENGPGDRSTRARTLANSRSGHPSSPLTAACRDGLMATVHVLLEYEADPDLYSGLKETPLFVASRAGQLGVTRLLLRLRVDVEKENREGQGPLFVASQAGHANLVQMLLAARACVNKKDKSGSTALLMASLNGHAKVVELLLTAGADRKVANMRGSTPLLLAKKSCHKKVQSAPKKRPLRRRALQRSRSILPSWILRRPAPVPKIRNSLRCLPRMLQLLAERPMWSKKRKMCRCRCAPSASG